MCIDWAVNLEDHITPTGALQIQNIINSFNQRYGIIVKKAIVNVGVNHPNSLKRLHLNICFCIIRQINTQSFRPLSRTIIVVPI
jgi:hypothetical protein